MKLNCLSDFIGNEKAVHEIHEWLKDPTTKALAVTGKSGYGKTSLLEVIAKENTYNFIWLNEDEINNFGSGSGSGAKYVKYKRHDLLKFLGMDQKKFLVVDDAYSLKGSKQVRDMIKLSKHLPIIFVTDNPKILKRVRDLTTVTLKPVPQKLLLAYFTKFIANQNVKLSQKDLREIIKGTNGDFRSIYHYFEIFVKTKKEPKVEVESPSVVPCGNSVITIVKSFKDCSVSDEDLVDSLFQRSFIPSEEKIYQIYHEGITNLIHKNYINRSTCINSVSHCADIFSYADAFLHENPFNNCIQHYYHHVIHLTIPEKLI